MPERNDTDTVRAVELSRPLILSASRTRDMVHRSPDLLADALSGTRPVRWGPYAPEGRLDVSRLHTVVLWTKAPGNLLVHDGLRRSIERLADDHGVGIALQLSVTGLGGSFIEPGIPVWHEVAATTAQLLEQAPWRPRAVTLRFDPFLAVATPGGRLFGNLDPAVYRTVLAPFLEMGITRVVTSRGDAVRYPSVRARMGSVGLRWRQVEDLRAEWFCRDLDGWCRRRGVAFSVCCEPPMADLVDRWGCLDSGWLNPLVPAIPAATTWRHNRLGKQRPACRCTYSKDIGYTTGAAHCFSGGFGCLYCYAQGRAHAPDVSRLQQAVAEFDAGPAEYLAARGLPAGLWIQEGAPTTGVEDGDTRSEGLGEPGKGPLGRHERSQGE